MDLVLRSFEATIDNVLPGERSVVARINTNHVDRYRTVIDPLGGDTRNYNRNGPVLWNHGKDAVRGSVPIGKGWVKVRQSERDLIGKTKFANDEFSQQIFEMYQDETLRGWSVNILPSEASPPTREEIRARPELADCEMIYRKWDLAEFSAVAVPGNADALTLIVSRGLSIPDDARAIYDARIPEEKPVVTLRVDQPHTVERRIVNKNGKYYVYSEDGSKKLGGPYSTRGEAAKRLEQIEYFKHKDEGRSAPEPEPEPVVDPLEQFRNTPRGRTFADTQLELVGAIRAWRDETKAEYEALRDLMMYGRV